MHWWAFLGLILALLSLAADVGMIEFPNKALIGKLEGGCPTILTTFLFIIVFGILVRMFQMEKRKEKEILQSEIEGLENRVEELEKDKPPVQ